MRASIISRKMRREHVISPIRALNNKETWPDNRAEWGSRGGHVNQGGLGDGKWLEFQDSIPCCDSFPTSYGIG